MRAGELAPTERVTPELADEPELATGLETAIATSATKPGESESEKAAETQSRRSVASIDIDQRHTEHSPWKSILDPDAAAMSFHGDLAERKSQAVVPAASVLGAALEPLEHRFPHVVSDARASIGHAKLDPIC
jgi:hypothetical protein